MCAKTLIETLKALFVSLLGADTLNVMFICVILIIAKNIFLNFWEIGVLGQAEYPQFKSVC